MGWDYRVVSLSWYALMLTKCEGIVRRDWPENT